MRYFFASLCFLAVLSACTFDDGKKPDSDSATAKAGKDLVLDIGVAKLVVPAAAIGSGTGQLPAGSRVTLSHGSKPSGRKLYSPVIKVGVKDKDGKAVTGLNLDPPATFELSYDAGLAGADGVSHVDLSLLSIKGSTIDELGFTTIDATADTQFNIPWPSRVRARFTSLASYAVGKHLVTTPPPPVVALTGTISTILTSTAFQLSSTGGTHTVNVLVPTGDTTTPPTVVTLNDASFNSANPLSPTNRIMTVQTGGKTYTTDHPAAGVVFQLNTFSGTNSSGSMLGTVVEQGGSATLAVNYTFTTGGAATVTLGGTVTEVAGRRTINLTDAAGDEQVLILMPDTFPNATLDPITFDDASFDSTDPLNAAGRLVTVTAGGDTFSSDVPVLGSVTVTFTSFDDVTLQGAGTITGTVVSATPANKTLNYTFTVTAGGPGGNGTLTPGTPVTVTTDAAHEAEVSFAFNFSEYIVAWIGDVGTTNRELGFAAVEAGTHAIEQRGTLEPTFNLDPAGGFALASNDVADVVAVGATGSDAGTATLVAVFYDAFLESQYGSDVNLGTGAFPRAAYHIDQDRFVLAWQSGSNVMAAVFTFNGTQVGSTVTMFTGATLAGLATAGDSTDEALITARDGSGVVGRYLTVSTGAASGAQFDLSTSEGGGMCVWEAAGGQYLVITETLVLGFFAAQQVICLATGTTVPVGSALTLPSIDAPSRAAWGADGAVFMTPSTALFAMDSSVAGAELLATPLYGSQQGGLDIDTSPNGPGFASDEDTEFVIVSSTGATGVTLQPLTLTP